MGIYTEDEYTLVHLRSYDALYTRISATDARGAHVARSIVSIGLVQPGAIDCVCTALNAAWDKVEAGLVGEWQIAGLDLRVGYSKSQLVAHVSNAGTAVARVDAEYLPLTGRVLKDDPSSSYEPVRHVVVVAGSVMLRRHRAQVAERSVRQQAAYRRVIRRAAEAVLVTDFLASGSKQ